MCDISHISIRCDIPLDIEGLSDEYSKMLLWATVLGAPRVRRLRDFKNIFGHFTICRFTDKSVADVPIMCPKLYYMQATQLYPYREISKHDVDLAIQCNFT